MKRRKNFLLAPVVLFVVFFATLNCSSNPEPPAEFSEAFRVLDKVLAADHLGRSAFASRFPNPTAREVVSFIFSEAGSDVLQIASTPTGEDVDPLSDTPVWPAGVHLWYNSPSGSRGKQIILSWKPDPQRVVGNAFLAGKADPVFLKEWEVVPLSPIRAPDPLDKRSFQAFE